MCESYLRVLRHQDNIVFVPIVVVHRDKPVALLHKEVWETTNKLLQKWKDVIMTVDDLKHNESSKFLHLKVVKSVKLGLML